MTMKSLYIVYITNCFLWTMSDNKAYLFLSYLNAIADISAMASSVTNCDSSVTALYQYSGSNMIVP